MSQKILADGCADFSNLFQAPKVDVEEGPARHTSR